MKISLNAPALALSVVALAVAAGGTGAAVAAVTNAVSIVDAVNPAKAVRVDTKGQLKVTGTTSDVNTLTFVNVSNSGASPITSPTTATLAVSKMSYFNPLLNTGTARTNFVMGLVKINVGSSGNCYDADATIATVYSRLYLPIGSSVVDPYATPLTVKPTGTTKYCLGVLTYSAESGGNPTSYWNPSAGVVAYVVSGSYTGVGTPGRPAPAPASPPQTTPEQPHPAGVGLPAE